MKHKMKISVSKTPDTSGCVAVRQMSIREKMLKRLLGTKCRLTVLVPGDTVNEITICEEEEGRFNYEEI